MEAGSRSRGASARTRRRRRAAPWPLSGNWQSLVDSGRASTAAARRWPPLARQSRRRSRTREIARQPTLPTRAAPARRECRRRRRRRARASSAAARWRAARPPRPRQPGGTQLTPPGAPRRAVEVGAPPTRCAQISTTSALGAERRRALHSLRGGAARMRADRLRRRAPRLPPLVLGCPVVPGASERRGAGGGAMWILCGSGCGCPCAAPRRPRRAGSAARAGRGWCCAASLERGTVKRTVEQLERLASCAGSLMAGETALVVGVVEA